MSSVLFHGTTRVSAEVGDDWGNPLRVTISGRDEKYRPPADNGTVILYMVDTALARKVANAINAAVAAHEAEQSEVAA